MEPDIYQTKAPIMNIITRPRAQSNEDPSHSLSKISTSNSRNILPNKINSAQNLVTKNSNSFAYDPKLSTALPTPSASQISSISKKIPKHSLSSQISVSFDPPRSTSPPAVPLTPPPKESTHKKGSVSNASVLDILFAKKNNESKTITSQKTTVPNKVIKQDHKIPLSQVDEIQEEILRLSSLFYRERAEFLKEIEATKISFSVDRKKTLSDVQNRIDTIINTIKKYDAFTVEMVRQFFAMQTEFAQFKENTITTQTAMQNQLGKLTREIEKFKTSSNNANFAKGSNEFFIENVYNQKSIGRTSSDSISPKNATLKKSKLKKLMMTQQIENDSSPSGSIQSLPISSKSNRGSECPQVDMPIKFQSSRKIEQFFGDSPMKSFTLESFLERLGYAKYISEFIREEITLSALFHMSEEHLMDLNIPMGPRLIILREAKNISQNFPNNNL